MLLIIGRASHARNNSEYRAQPIVRAIDCVRHPTASSPMPAFALENFVPSRARASRWRHHAQCSRMRLFFERALAQKLLHICLACERALCLIMEFGFLAFFSGFHAANRDLRACNLVPPTIQPARNGVPQNGRLGSEVSQLLLPTLRVPFFRFRHAQEDTFAFLVSFAFGEIAISLRSLDFSLPVAPDHLYRSLSIFRITRWIFAAHDTSISWLQRSANRRLDSRS